MATGGPKEDSDINALRSCPIQLVACVLGLLILPVVTGACGGDGDAEGALGTKAPTRSDEIPVSQVVGIVADYLGNQGVDGETFQLAEAADCAAIQDEEVNAGKVCVLFGNSTTGKDSAEIKVQLVGSSVFWTLTLRRQTGKWLVTEVASEISE